MKNLFWMTKEKKKSTKKHNIWWWCWYAGCMKIAQFIEHTHTHIHSFVVCFFSRKIEIIGFAADCSLFEFKYAACRNQWQLIPLECNWFKMRQKKSCCTQLKCDLHLFICLLCIIVEMLVHCSQLKGFVWFGYKTTNNFEEKKYYLKMNGWTKRIWSGLNGAFWHTIGFRLESFSR